MSVTDRVAYAITTVLLIPIEIASKTVKQQQTQTPKSPKRETPPAEAPTVSKRLAKIWFTTEH
jgi:hypothetical protein